MHPASVFLRFVFFPQNRSKKDALVSRDHREEVHQGRGSGSHWEGRGREGGLVMVGQGSLLTRLYGLCKQLLDELGSLPQTSSHWREGGAGRGAVSQGEEGGVLKGWGRRTRRGMGTDSGRTGLQGRRRSLEVG